MLVDAADDRHVTGVAELSFGEVLLDIRFKPADQRSSSIQPVIWRSVAELMAEMLRKWYAMANCLEINSLCWRTGCSRAS